MPAHDAVSVYPSPPSSALGPGDYTLSMTVGTMTRTLILHVPPGPTVPNRPLVLVYHGNLDTAANTIKQTNFEQASNKSGYLVAFLQGYSNSWDNVVGSSPAVKAHIDDVGFTTTAIATIAGLAPFDQNRIAAVGFSAGALMVEYLGCVLAGTLALIVPVEGQLPVTIASSCAPSRALSVYEIHGTADTAIPYNGGYFHGVYGGTTVLSAPASVARWAQLDQCGSTPSTSSPSSSIKLTSYTGCANGTSAVLRTIVGGGHVWGSNIGQLVAHAIPAGP
jgi:polyhydroxybutyrate depolymerase